MLINAATNKLYNKSNEHYQRKTSVQLSSLVRSIHGRFISIQAKTKNCRERYFTGLISDVLSADLFSFSG